MRESAECACGGSSEFNHLVRNEHKNKSAIKFSAVAFFFVGYASSANAIPFESRVETSATAFSATGTIEDVQIDGGPLSETASASSSAHTTDGISSVSASANSLTGQAKFTASSTGGAQAAVTYSLLDTLYFSRPNATIDESVPFSIRLHLDGIAQVSETGIYQISFGYEFFPINITLPVAARNFNWDSVFFPFNDYSVVYDGFMTGQSAQLSISMYGSGLVQSGSLNFGSTGAVIVNVPSDVSVISAANNGPASYVNQGDVVSVPEPASIAIMISGFLLIQVFRINGRARPARRLISSQISD